MRILRSVCAAIIIADSLAIQAPIVRTGSGFGKAQSIPYANSPDNYSDRQAMAACRILFTPIACVAITACQWVDSAGTQTSNGTDDIRFAPVLELSEETPGQLDFSNQLANGIYNRSWRISEQGILPACAGSIDPEVTAANLESACNPLEDSCEVMIIEQSGAQSGAARYTLLPPRLSSPIGLQYRWDFESGNATESYSVTLCIKAVNEKPVASNDTYFTHAKSTLTVAGPERNQECRVELDDSWQTALLHNDSDDRHHQGPCLVAELLTPPNFASNDFTAEFKENGGFSYSATADAFNTSDSFTYRVFDGELYSEPATVKISVSRDETQPVANFDIFKVSANSHDNQLDVLANDENPLPHTLKISAISVFPDNGGSALIHADQSILYTPAPNFRGVEYLAYTIENIFAETDTAWIAVRVR